MMFPYLKNCFQPSATSRSLHFPLNFPENRYHFYSVLLSELSQYLPHGIEKELLRHGERGLNPEHAYLCTAPSHHTAKFLNLCDLVYHVHQLSQSSSVSEAFKEVIYQKIAESKNASALYFNLSTILISYFRQTGSLAAYLVTIRNRIVLYASEITKQDCNQLARLMYNTSAIPFSFYNAPAPRADWDTSTWPELQKVFQRHFDIPIILTKLIAEIRFDLHQNAGYRGVQEVPYTKVERNAFMLLLSTLFHTTCDDASFMRPDHTDLNWFTVSQSLLAAMIAQGHFEDFMTPSLHAVQNTDDPTLSVTWPKDLITSPQNVFSFLPFLTNTLAGAYALLKTQKFYYPDQIQIMMYDFARMTNDPTQLETFKTVYYRPRKEELASYTFNDLVHPNDPTQTSPFFLFYIQDLSIKKQIALFNDSPWSHSSDEERALLTLIIRYRPNLLKAALDIIQKWPESTQVDRLKQPCQYAIKNNQYEIFRILFDHIKNFSSINICHTLGVVSSQITSLFTQTTIQTNWVHFDKEEASQPILHLLHGIANLSPEKKREILTYDQNQCSLFRLVLNFSPNQTFFDNFYAENDEILSSQLMQMQTLPLYCRKGHMIFLNTIKRLTTAHHLPGTFLPSLLLDPQKMAKLKPLQATSDLNNALQDLILMLAETEPTVFFNAMDADPEEYIELFMSNPEKLARFFSIMPPEKASNYLTKNPKNRFSVHYLVKAVSSRSMILDVFLQTITSTLLQPAYFNLLFQSPFILDNLIKITDPHKTLPFRNAILALSEDTQALFFEEMDRNPHKLLSLFLCHEDEGIHRLFNLLSPERQIQYLIQRDNEHSLLDKALVVSQRAATLSILSIMKVILSGEQIKSILIENHCDVFKKIAKLRYYREYALLIDLLDKCPLTFQNRYTLFLIALETQHDETRGILFLAITNDLLKCNGRKKNDQNARKLFAAIVEGYHNEKTDTETSYQQLIHTEHGSQFSFNFEIKCIQFLELIKKGVSEFLFRSLLTSYLNFLCSSYTTIHRCAFIEEWDSVFEANSAAESFPYLYLQWIKLHNELMSISSLSPLTDGAPLFFSSKKLTIPPSTSTASSAPVTP